MPVQPTSTAATAELEALTAAAAERVRGDVEERQQDLPRLDQLVREAAGAALAAGAPLASIADAERLGRARARGELGPDALKAITRAAKRRREAEADYEKAIRRAGRLGLAHREIADAAEVAHGTVRAIITRAQGAEGEQATPSADGADPADGHHEDEWQH